MTIGIKLSLFALLTFPALGYGWGQNGHRITAEIAERNLDPKAEKEVRKILGLETMAEIATWPDDIRSIPEWDFVKIFHYATIEDDETVAELVTKEAADPDLNSTLEVLPVLEKFLRDPDAKKMTLKGYVEWKGVRTRHEKEITKWQALAFYVHFVGDLHQPLHVGRGDDLGGNRVKVAWFNEETNLHKVWDELMIESLQLSYTELSTFLNRATEETQAEWTSGGPEDWARESKEARAQVYRFGPQKKGPEKGAELVPSLSYQYRADNIKLLRERLAKGGYRLAEKLNEIFADYPD